MNEELEKQGCTCEAGYYCRYCRILDREQEQREYEENKKQ